MESVFHKAVSRIFDSWTALQLAIQGGCDGAATLEKARWLVDAVEQWMTENKNVEPYELEEILLSILEVEFQLNLEDGSEVQMAKDIVECFECCQRGKDVSKFLNLPKVSTEQLAQSQCMSELSSSSDDDDDDDDDQDSVPQLVPIALQSPKASQAASDKNSETAIDGNKASTSHSSTTSNKESSAMDEDDEWTTVVRHKKR